MNSNNHCKNLIYQNFNTYSLLIISLKSCYNQKSRPQYLISKLFTVIQIIQIQIQIQIIQIQIQIIQIHTIQI